MIRLFCFGHSILIVKSFSTLSIRTKDVVGSDLVTIRALPWLSVYFIIWWRARERWRVLINWPRFYILNWCLFQLILVKQQALGNLWAFILILWTFSVNTLTFLFFLPCWLLSTLLVLCWSDVKILGLQSYCFLYWEWSINIQRVLSRCWIFVLMNCKPWCYDSSDYMKRNTTKPMLIRGIQITQLFKVLVIPIQSRWYHLSKSLQASALWPYL